MSAFQESQTRRRKLAGLTGRVRWPSHLSRDQTLRYILSDSPTTHRSLGSTNLRPECAAFRPRWVEVRCTTCQESVNGLGGHMDCGLALSPMRFPHPARRPRAASITLLLVFALAFAVVLAMQAVGASQHQKMQAERVLRDYSAFAAARFASRAAGAL